MVWSFASFLRLGGGHKGPAAGSPEASGPSPAPVRAQEGAPDLSKIDRVQLLQLLRDAMEENDRLREQVAAANRLADEAEGRLEDRRIQLEDSESLAEAALRLSGVFADAQRAIDLYAYNRSLNRDREASWPERSDRGEDVTLRDGVGQSAAGWSR